MQTKLLWLLLCLAAVGFADHQSSDHPGDHPGDRPGDRPHWNWDQWNTLPVLDGGRHKPFGVFAMEAVRGMRIRQDLRDPRSGQRLDSTAVYLALLLDHHSGSVAAGESRWLGVAGDQADAWDQRPLFPIDLPALRRALSLPAGQRYVSARQLLEASIRDPRSGQATPFLAWAERRPPGRQTRLETEAVRLATGLRQYLLHRSGMRLKLLPLPSSPDGDWISVHRLVTSAPGEIADETAALRRCRELWLDVEDAYRKQAAARFNQVSAAFMRHVSQVGPMSGDYPSATMIRAELSYHTWRPFRLAWVLAAGACLLGICSLLSRRGPWHQLALITLAAAAVVMCVGFGWRMFIAGRAPVTNMYESMIYVALGTSLLGLVLQRKQRQKLVLTATAAISAVVLLLADSFPENLDPGFQPLPPALRTNFWLVVHVLSVTFSYSAFTVSLGIGNITLGYFLFRSQAEEAVAKLDRLNDVCLQLGVLLLTVGTVTGGIWADYSWGRFWGWDPKEVWSLVTLAGYLAVLHARYAGVIGPFGFAGLSVICYSLVVITWYGVNFLLGSGLHSYGGGSGGLWLVTAWLAVQFGYVAAAATRSAVIPR